MAKPDKHQAGVARQLALPNDVAVTLQPFGLEREVEHGLAIRGVQIAPVGQLAHQRLER